MTEAGPVGSALTRHRFLIAGTHAFNRVRHATPGPNRTRYVILIGLSVA